MSSLYSKLYILYKFSLNNLKEPRPRWSLVYPAPKNLMVKINLTIYERFFKILGNNNNKASFSDNCLKKIPLPNFLIFSNNKNYSYLILL